MDFSEDYYQILGVADTASQEEIRHAYRLLALCWHPDKHVGESPERVAAAEANFKRIARAYETLSDPIKRSNYDIRRSYYSTPRAESGTYYGPTPGRQSQQGGYSGQYYGSKYGYYYQSTSARPRYRHARDSRWTSFKAWMTENGRIMIITLCLNLFRMGDIFKSEVGSKQTTGNYQYEQVHHRARSCRDFNYWDVSSYHFNIGVPIVRIDIPDIVIPDVGGLADEGTENELNDILENIKDLQKQIHKWQYR